MRRKISCKALILCALFIAQSTATECNSTVTNDTSSSINWLERNLGNFSNYASLEELKILNAKFSSVAVLGLLSSEQKAQFILQPDSGVLGNDSVFREVFSIVITSLDLNQLGSFFTAFNQTAIQMNLTSIPPTISDTILNMTLLYLVPHFQSFSPDDFALWFQTYLSFFLPGIGPNTLSIIPMNISCDSYREIVQGLDNVYSDLSAAQSNIVFNYTKDYLKYQSSQGLSCYDSGNFYMFLKELFLSFGFPDLKDFLSLIPADRQEELLGSISPKELSEFLNKPNTVVNGSELCTLLTNYNRTDQFLEMEPVFSSALASHTLECVWPRALSASSQADVEQWFNVTLVHYLPYLSSQLISSAELSGASCLSYRKLVSILGDNYNFSATDFTPADVYSSIKVYLNSSDGSPRCYNSSDPLLNSTAWFVDNIGFFITFIKLVDMQTFLSGSMISVFLENSENLQLFNNSGISASVLEYYTTELYIQNPYFSPLSLPAELLCQTPSSVFVHLGDADVKTILTSINNFCTEINPEVTAVLVAKFPNVSASTIQSLGSQCVGLTVGQISSAPSDVINSALSTLSNINGWDQGQMNALIQSIISAGFNAMMLFGAVASASDNPEDLSASVLQGFSCSSVQTLPQQKTKDLVKACSPRVGRDKVLLKEAQLTCMYNYVKDDAFVDFTDVPADMLLYYSYEKIQKVNCQSYFSALGKADFSVLSAALDKKTILFNDAKDCLGISDMSLTRDQVEVLGNMACTLDSSYIQNSDPLILEKLKNCGDLSDSQITAVQSLLLSGNTAYGNPSTWNEQMVEQLGILAVYFKSDLCNTLNFNVKRKFLSVLREQKIPTWKIRTFFTECNSESATVSNITAATIADASFPFGFNSTQFDLFLDVAVLQDNLAAITEKVVDTSLQTVILNKLNQIYPLGLTDGVLQLLGSTSRVASIDDISNWNITIIDTLSSLMDSNDGQWEPKKSKAVIMRYLSMDNRSMGNAEISVVGSNICTLDISVLENISAESLKALLSPDLSSCSIEQKSALYIIANSSFSNQRSNAITYYQLMSPYLAPVEDIQALSALNISMDITIFMSLNPAVLQILNVSTVRYLLGVNIADLKLFENSSVVQSWVSQQNQSDLNTLNLGIINHNPCHGVNISPLEDKFASGIVSAVLCNFSIPDYACSSVVLSSDDLVTLLTCTLERSVTYSKEAWMLFFQNFAGPLDEALNKFSNMTHSSVQSDPKLLDAIGEVIVKNFITSQLMNATFITEWFQMRLRPFLSSVSRDFLSSLSSKTFSCESYQIVVEALSSQESLMTEEQKQLVFTSFIFPFLSRRQLPDPGCVSNTSSSNNWLEKNLGNFSNYASLEELKILNANFSSVAVLGLLSSEQKAQFILQPDSGVLGNDSVFREVFSIVITSLDLNQLGSFFTAFNQTAIQMNLTSIPPTISDTILNMTLLYLVPHFQSFSPDDFALWFQTYLSFFLPGIGPNILSIIPMNISCDSYREIVQGLDNVYSDLSAAQSNIVFSYTKDYLKYQSSQGLSCYDSGSFYMFLKELFLSFGFPDLKDFLSLIPADRQEELLGSISPKELSEFLNRPNTVVNGSELCTLLTNYNRTDQFLEMEPVLSSALASHTLECVWPRALSASSQADVEQWFNVTLVHYLPYLSSQLISSAELSGASCLSYRKLVSILGDNYNFSATDFTPADVYSSIIVYLNSSDGSPRCYNSSDPLLNSTAWFVDNIGFFITFIKLIDLQTFLSGSMISVFLENSENLQLFNNSGISARVLQYYTTELYIQNPYFSPLSLPAELLCQTPSSVFVHLGDADVKTILTSINNFCTEINPEVTAVLVAKFPNVSASTIQSLGSQCVGLTVGQISSAPSDVINSALSTLSNINGWDQGQMNALIQSIISAGFNISSASSLVSLGTLIGGVPSTTISNIPSSQLLSLSQNPSFIHNILSAPVILQQTFVQKVISVDQTEVIQNVPDALVMYIPLVLLTSLSSVDISLINNKSWSHEQAMMLFGAVASASDNPEDLSASVLQGFSCSSVQTLPQQKTKDLVKACSPRVGRDKVLLKEAQLTCMYNYVKDDAFVDFTDVPADMLLYYSYEKIQKVNCQSYFSALGRADFSVLSAALDKKTILFNDAKDCLGISDMSLTRDQVEVLGNMACTLDSSYIQNSDPLILEKLKNCGDLSDSQITAVQSLLLSGNTAYGEQHHSGNNCRCVISFRGFNSTQFDLFLDALVLQDNLAAITEKVVDTSLQTVILNKLNQIYPLGLTDGVLQLLGSTSRVASIDDISNWNITIIDTLSSLMDSNDGQWEPKKSKAVIMRYLSMDNRSMGNAEISVVGSNICTLDISVLENISAESLKALMSPDLSSCSNKKKSSLYIIANSSFSNQRSNAITYYQLMSPYLGGAPVEDIQALSALDISMDITIFMSLNPAVLQILNVSTVRHLMGVNIADLKLFENSSVVQSWVSQQNQSDLNTLNLGIINHNPCQGVNISPLEDKFASGIVSAVLCYFSIPDYACSSVVLSSDDLVTLLTCTLEHSMNYSKEAWMLFFQNFAGPLDEALDKFSTMVAVLGLLSSEQKAQFILQPDSGVLGNDSVFREVFSIVITSLDLNQLGSFFTAFNQTVIQMNLTSIPPTISDTILNMTLLYLVPHFQSFSPDDFALWFQTYLSFFLPGIGPNTLSIIPMNISCDSYREIVQGLDNVYSDLSAAQSNIVFNYTKDYLKYQSSQGLSCYDTGSFYMFLKKLFLSFGFPDLKNFLSLIPADRQEELLGSISPEELSEFLNKPNTVVNGSELCTLLTNYNRTHQFLEMEPVLSSALASHTLECVWPRALSASSQADVEQWFNVTLVHYLPYLSSQLISSAELSGASCLSYRKLVSILGDNYNFSVTDFTPADVYSSIKVYLNSSDGSPRCYNSSDPLLNSTAWFVDNIGFFITFIKLVDLQTFLSGSMISVFLENSENLQLFNNSGISARVLEYYTTELYIQNPYFSPLSLPAELLCQTPSSVFVHLGDADVKTILTSINNFCTEINPEVTAVLVAKFPNVSASTIQSLGSQCVGLTVGQISSALSDVINSALSTLSNINGWDQGQMNALIQSIISAGFNISSASSLVSLGTLIGGVPSTTISNIPSSQLLSLSQNPSFIHNILSAPVILQQTFVQKVISVDQTEVIQNVPDALVMYIPLVLLTSLSSVDISLINNKSWSHEQAMMLFGAVASASDNPEDLSASVLQGFSCSSVQTLPQQKTKDLVKACSPRVGRDKVLLKEAQLTCMYNYVKDDAFVDFTDVPADMLLYYSYEKIQKVNCQSYFSALGRADFSVLSAALDKKTILFNDAKGCLGISDMSLTRDQVEVLGNMACTLDSSYIQNSDPLILEKLKNCGDLSDSQITAVQSLLLSGNTAYGNPSTWNEQTVEQLGILAVYFKSDLCNTLNFNVKRKFLAVLREQKIPTWKIRTFFTECNSESATVSNITAATIADASFPFGFNSTQFDLFLDVAVLQDNLAAITEKVVDTSLQTVILNKLNQIYPLGLTDGVLQLLGSTSRVASIDDISNWNITLIDTLSSLMDSNDGQWEPKKSKAVIMRYLSMDNRSMGNAEISVVGSNICTLDISVLENISAESLKALMSPDLSSCSIEQKYALYIIANSSFSNQRSNAITYYQLMSPYLGGAPVEDIQALSALNISMDITIFMSLNPAVLQILNVSTVRYLLGVNIADLKLFENSSVVQSWVSQQNQSDLNTLNLGIINHNPCQGVNIYPLEHMFASGIVSAVLCNFSIPDYACSSVVLSSDDLATLLTCTLERSVTYSKEAWMLFFQNFAGPLGEALDKFSNMTHSSVQSDPKLLDAIGEVIIKNFTTAQLMNATFITEWFQMRLRPFLSSVSRDFLSSLSSKTFSCESYPIVVEALSSQESLMTEEQKQLVFTSFIFPFLSRRQLPEPGCVSNTSSSNNWLEKNLGNFSNYASLEELKILNANFSSVAVLGLLSSEQKAQFILQPDSGVLGNDSVFREVFSIVITSLDLNQLGSFFTAFNQTVIQMNLTSIPPTISDTILNMTLLYLVPHFQSFSPDDFSLWFQTYLSLFLPGIGPNTLSIIPMNISCDSYREIVQGLDNVYSDLSAAQSNIVFNYTKDYLKYQSSQGLSCYDSGSFYMFLKELFLSFGFPDLKDFLSLIPADRQEELLDSISPEELSEFLNRPNTVVNGSELCTLLTNYNRTHQFLEMEPVLSSALASHTLECVWPRALSASSQADVEQWFNVTLVHYLPYLSSQLISSAELSGASCLSYRKLVSILGDNYNFSVTDFTPADVYSSIKVYLNSSDGSPRCYNSSDPLLNSTAWFVDNIGFFITFIKLVDLQTFLSGSMISVFLENSENLQLFNNSGISASVLQYYTTELYIQNPYFSPLSLPAELLCQTPSSVFVHLGDADVKTILTSINNFCTEINPEPMCGPDCGPDKLRPSDVINSALSTLSNINGWDQGQMNALIQSIISAGFNISSTSSLVSLGTLIGGVPSTTISNIPSSQLLSLSQNPTFIHNILSAPFILQQTFVQKVISVDQTEVIQNVPDALVMYIPLVLLTSLSSVDISLINNKSWSHEQAMMLFGAVASASDNPEDLSASVLQGFSCSSVQTLPQQKTKDLVKACRPRTGRDKVLLKEAQLTCMYNYVKDNAFVDFTDVPADMLLYYSYEKIQKVNCQSYFSALGRADFSVLSAALDKKTILFNDAKDCLGITGVSLTRDQVEVLGNMACTLDSSYIQNSDPLILEKLKNCGDLSDSQITAVQSLLLSGNTAYGNPSTWNEQTVEQLGILAVYFKSDLCNTLNFNVKRKFLSVLREQKIPTWKIRTFFTECNSESATVSNITAATIADASFPFGFKSTQFDLYLDVAVLQDNLAAITEKVVDTSLQTVILNKLNQIYPLGLTDGVLQLLGSTSRVASIDDIRNWNITIIDTLSSLMDSNDGQWEPEKSKAVIMRYLSMDNRSMGNAEISVVGSNICTLDISVLENISAESIKALLSPDLSSCSIKQKSALYIIANSSFSNQHSNAITYYQLMSPYLGGAPLEDIQALSTHCINMDITIFTSLNPAVLKVAVLSSDDLAKLLQCKLTGSIKYPKEVWKLFFHNLAAPLNEALDKVYNMNLSNVEADPSILNAIGEVIINDFTAAQLNNATFVTKWFQMRLRPFLSSVSTDFLSHLSSKNFSCETYQIVVESLSSQESLMSIEQRQSVITSFIFPFLSRADLPDPGCVSNTSSSINWLEKKLGNFSIYASLEELKILNANFSSVAVLGLLSSEQKAQFILQPDSGVLGNDSMFREVFSIVITSLDLNQLGSFFTAFNQTAIQMNLTSIPPTISDTILNMTLLYLVPHFQSFSPDDFALWFQTYLSFFLPGIGPNTLSIIPMNISCLSCYDSRSFYMFLKELFLSFGFPDLKDFLSLIPADRQEELLDSISPEELSEFLNRPNTVVNGSELCTLLTNYNRTDQFLEMEPVLSSALASHTLECVWPRALSASSQADVEQWFNVTLVHYLPYLSSQLISSAELSGASCLSYRKLVSILGDNYNFSATDFTPADVYSSIKVYLNSSDGSPHCYNSSDPFLNSTAWFANNIGFFITFITLTDLRSFISDSKIGVFLENSENLQLFSNSEISANVTGYYTTQLYIQNPNFIPLRLPGGLLCEAPASAFVPLGIADSQIILSNINKFCNETNPEVTAALVEKFSNVSAHTIQLLGSQSVGLTVGQISSIPYSVINSALPTLSNISGWDQGQENALIQSIISAGVNISSASSLFSLGTLIGGVPSSTISSIPSSQLLSLSQNAKFINNILSAPVILQETYVQQVISADQSKVIENVPDALVMYIPVILLSSLSSVESSLLNNKSWSHEQAMMLFGAVANASDNPEDLSASVLQGFSCNSVQTLPQQKNKDLVKACRPRAGRDKVLLKEAQLTCMYNNLKEDPVNFTDVPTDMLLYYSYEKVQHGNCRSYFTALGGADFSVPSSVLNKPATLFNNARDCLGISGESLTRDQVEVLGNMACTLDSSYIENSDPLILEKMKNCGDISHSQITAVQSLLLSGNTTYGNPLKWNVQTLEQLSILPLYFTSDFWGQISSDLKKIFLKTFMPFLRNQKTPIQKQRNLFTECNSKVSKVRRAAACTTGTITPVTIADASFPLGYDSTQFDLCLNISVLQDNLAAITEKVVDTSFQTVILNKLNQIYPSGLNDNVLQLLGSTSRVATIDDIRKWNITIIDTLSSLMNSDNGNWAPEMSKAVITRYLNIANHTLGTAEINAVGSNICSLDVNVLENITTESLKNANTLDLSSCSIQQKSALYIISNSSFSGQRSTARIYYQLISPYLG
ncbi:hypothetical protein AMELA_G00235980, partial [Ameiurus melas]